MSVGRLPLQLWNEAELKYVPLHSMIECREVLTVSRVEMNVLTDALDTVNTSAGRTHVFRLERPPRRP
jgi:hypothetical protein